MVNRKIDFYNSLPYNMKKDELDKMNEFLKEHSVVYKKEHSKEKSIEIPPKKKNYYEMDMEI